MTKKNPLDPLIDVLSQLPGIGPKSAQRLAFHLLSLPADTVNQMASVMTNTRQNIRYCGGCFNISLAATCDICLDTERDAGVICVVAHPKDVFAMERTGAFKGHYHVLGGLISPIDGMHPEALRIEELITRVRGHSIQELVMAINPTVEGDATMLYLTQLISPLNIPVTRLAHGLPIGADIDYADELTLQKAFVGRTAA